MNQPETKLQFKPNLTKRIIATLLDYGLFMMAVVIYVYVYGERNLDGNMEVNGLKALIVPIAWLLYLCLKRLAVQL